MSLIFKLQETIELQNFVCLDYFSSFYYMNNFLNGQNTVKAKLFIKLRGNLWRVLVILLIKHFMDVHYVAGTMLSAFIY